MIEEMLDKKFKCNCGKEHLIEIKKILFEKNAVNKLARVLNQITSKDKVLIISDQNTYQAAGKKAEELLVKNGYQINSLILPEEQPKPEPKNLFKIIREITDDLYILACGSGTINDLTAYAAYKIKKPYSVLATAPSMDGYASSVSSITADGVKQTYNTKPPEAIIADTIILSNADKELIKAGYGDLLGKCTSLLDWKLAHLIFDEYYCEMAGSIVENELLKIIKPDENKKLRDLEKIANLIKGLIYSGIAMQMVESSRPASGSEHHVSHFIEMFSEHKDQKTPLHGKKVGLATLFTTSFYLKLKNLNYNVINLDLDKEKRQEEIKKIYNQRAEPILKNLERRWAKELLTKDEILNKKDDILSLINENLDTIKNTRKVLIKNELFSKNDFKIIPKNLFKKALKYGFEIRARYTVTTFLKQINLLDQTVDELLLEYYK